MERKNRMSSFGKHRQKQFEFHASKTKRAIKFWCPVHFRRFFCMELVFHQQNPHVVAQGFTKGLLCACSWQP